MHDINFSSYLKGILVFLLFNILYLPLLTFPPKQDNMNYLSFNYPSPQFIPKQGKGNHVPFPLLLLPYLPIPFLTFL